MPIKLSKAESKVLIAMADGYRSFSNSHDIRALHKLSDRGLIEVRFDAVKVQRCKKWNFGRNWKYVTETSVCALITNSTKIDRAISRHGKTIFIDAVVKAVA